MNNAKRKSTESGEVMLEGMIITILTVFILIWILGVGFVYYQRYVTTIVTNDAAVKIASTYNNPTSDIIMGYITTEDLSSRDLYRNYNDSENSDLRATNEERAECYVKYVLDKTNFSGVVNDVDVELTLVTDSLFRKHIKIVSTCEYNTPFGQIFDMFGMKRSSKYSVTACADCTDYSDYISSVGFLDAISNTSTGSKVVDEFIKMINSFVKIYNHKHS